ncbi:MAG TPA: YfhO family protein [Rhodocyclaceae bacterium]|nr:YfhO family protein [Rhodocyclaceae bacterium]
MLLQRLWPTGILGWTFSVGLGAPVAHGLFPDLFEVLTAVAGGNDVAGFRIWVYCLKLMLAGQAFFWLARTLGIDRLVAVAVGVSYTLCGYATVDAQWAVGGTELIFYPAIAAALLASSRRTVAVATPLVMALACYAGVFAFAIFIFVVLLAVFDLACAANRRQRLRRWLGLALPASAIGALLAAPTLLPTVINLLDSNRVINDSQSLLRQPLSALLLNDSDTVVVQLAGLFHKDLLGVGSFYRGWMNYLEGPGFYVGVLSLLALPQLIHGRARERRIGIALAVVLVFYIASPILRGLPYGFVVPYFRVSSLWLSMLLLAGAGIALTRCRRSGLDRRTLGLTAALVLALFIYLAWFFQQVLYQPHAVKIFLLLAGGVFLLLMVSKRQGLPFAVAILLACVIDSLATGYSPANVNRWSVSPSANHFRDGSEAALAFLKWKDADFFRVEKTYESVSLADAVYQDYRGVKSYAVNGSGVVDFYLGTDALPPRSDTVNHTNWLPGFDQRIALNALLGVKYLISRTPLSFEGLQPVYRDRGLYVYQNDLALPLGVVYERYIDRREFLALPSAVKDVALFHAAVLDRDPGQLLPRISPTGSALSSRQEWELRYRQGAIERQLSGMKIEHFDDNRISGRVTARAPSVLVFSIPQVPGWQARVDGFDVPFIRANLGMLGLPLPPGEHRIELSYAKPGVGPGALIFLMGIFFLAGLIWIERSRLKNYKLKVASA